MFFQAKIEGSYPIWVDMISAKKVIGEHGGFHRDSVAVGCFDSPSSAERAGHGRATRVTVTVFGMMHGFLGFPTFSVLSSLLGGSSLSYFCEDLQFSLKHRAEMR